MSSTRLAPTSQQRLPTELIQMIFEHAVEKHGWQLPKLALISKQIRLALLCHLYQHVHLYSVEKMDTLVVRGWPRALPLDQSLRRRAKREELKGLPTKLALYLHFLYAIESEDRFYDELLDRVEDIASHERGRIETLGIRTLPSNKAYLSLGLWTSNLFHNLNRLYVDSTLLPPFSDTQSPEEVLSSFENLQTPLPGNPNELPLILFTNPNKLEAYALAGSSLGAIFGHMEGLHGQRRFIRDVFPKLKRLYLFTCAWQEDGHEMHHQLDTVAADFDAVTNVDFILNVVIQGREPASWCAPEASVHVYPNGTMVVKHVVVDQPQDQDILALMHRIIDDFDAEWAPEAFRGRRWPPSTRPRYTTAIPSRLTVQRAGIVLPQRQKINRI